MNDIRQNELLREIFREATRSPESIVQEPDANDLSHPVNDDELLIRWSHGDLEPAEHRQIVEHLAGCAYCRSELAAMIRAGAFTLPEQEMSEQGSGKPSDVSTRPRSAASDYSDPSKSVMQHRTIWVVTAVAASLLVAAIWTLSNKPTDRYGSLVAMAQSDLDQGQPGKAFDRLGQYFDDTSPDTRDPKIQVEANRLFEESGYRLANRAFQSESADRARQVRDIESKVTSRTGSSARLLNLRLQADRGAQDRQSLATRGTLLDYGVSENGLHPDTGTKGFMYDFTSDLTEAEKRFNEEFSQAVQTHPDSLDLRLNYGQFLLEHGGIPQAIDQFEAAVKLAPDNPLAQTGLGLALFRQDTDESIQAARKHFQKAIELSPGNPTAQKNLTICNKRLKSE